MELIYLTKWFEVIKEIDKLVIKPVETDFVHVEIPYSEVKIDIRGNGIDVHLRNRDYELVLKFFNLPIWVIEFNGVIKEVNYEKPILTISSKREISLIDCQSRKKLSLTHGEVITKLSIDTVYAITCDPLGFSMKFDDVKNVENIYAKITSLKNLNKVSLYVECPRLAHFIMFMCLGNVNIDKLCSFKVLEEQVSEVVVDSRKIFFKVVEVLEEPYFTISTPRHVKCIAQTSVKIPIEVCNKGTKDGPCVIYVKDEFDNIIFVKDLFVEKNSSKVIELSIPCVDIELTVFVQNLVTKEINDEKRIKIEKIVNAPKFTIVDIEPRKIVKKVGDEFIVKVKVKNVGIGEGKVIIELWSSKSRQDAVEVVLNQNEEVIVELRGIVEKSGLSTYRVVLYNVTSRQKEVEDYVYVEGVEKSEDMATLIGIATASSLTVGLVTWLLMSKEGQEALSKLTEFFNKLLKS